MMRNSGSEKKKRKKKRKRKRKKKASFSHTGMQTFFSKFVPQLKPSKFIEPNEEIYTSLKKGIKFTYDNLKMNPISGSSEKFNDILVDDFDIEQIWSQLEGENPKRMRLLEKGIEELAEKEKKDEFDFIKPRVKLLFQSTSMLDEEIQQEEEVPEIQEKPVVVGSEKGEDEGKEGFIRKEDFLPDFELKEGEVVKPRGENEQQMHAFLSKMEADLKEIDNLEENVEFHSTDMYHEEGQQNKGGEEQELDLFSEDLEGNNVLDPTFPLLDEDEDSSEEEEEESGEEAAEKSMFQKRQEELMAEIESLEKSIQPENKPWQEEGEANRFQRPKHSLLHEEVSFTSQVKPKPVITEERTKDLESIIINRILNNRFDDPVPYVAPTDEEEEGDSLDKMKDRRGLDVLMEKEYRQRVLGEDVGEEEMSESGKEIMMRVSRNMNRLLHTLNAMSSFNYITPSAAIEESEVIGDQEAVQVRRGEKQAAMVEENVPTVQSAENLDLGKEIMEPAKKMPYGMTEKRRGDFRRKRKRKDDLKRKLTKKRKTSD